MVGSQMFQFILMHCCLFCRFDLANCLTCIHTVLVPYGPKFYNWLPLFYKKAQAVYQTSSTNKYGTAIMPYVQNEFIPQSSLCALFIQLCALFIRFCTLFIPLRVFFIWSCVFFHLGSFHLVMCSSILCSIHPVMYSHLSHFYFFHSIMCSFIWLCSLFIQLCTLSIWLCTLWTWLCALFIWFYTHFISLYLVCKLLWIIWGSLSDFTDGKKREEMFTSMHARLLNHNPNKTWRLIKRWNKFWKD